MRGCVAKDESGAFILQSMRGAKVKLSSAEDLSKHIGQEVKISGAFMDTGDPASASSGKSSKPRVERAFRVLRLDAISQTCKVPPAKKR